MAIGKDGFGRDYSFFFQNLFRKSHETYARRHGYDYRVVTDYLDTAFQHKKLIVFQKWLVACQPWAQKYEYVIFIDADTLIHPEAPPIHLAAPYGDKIGIVDEYSQPTPEKRLEIQIRNKWETTSTEYYKLCDFECTSPHVLNSGVLVIQPKIHASLLQSLYDTYFEEAIGHPRTVYEQTALGYELLQRGMAYILPNEWNSLTMLYMESQGRANTVDEAAPLLELIKKSWIVHFAADHSIDLIQNLPEEYRQPPTPEDLERWSRSDTHDESRLS
jgi:hypothetical protein